MTEHGAEPPRPRARDLLRTLGALVAIPAGLAVGVAALLARRERREAVNWTYASWGRLGLSAAGIELAIEGAEELESARPAVFLINHQSGIDPLLVCALLRRDFVGVAKQELRRNLLLGPALAFAGTVFLDRFDRTRAVRQLASGIETLRRGLSVAVAPEGRRSPGAALGSFKKGAFRLAMAAGVPVVPIVLHDSARVLPRHAWCMRPGTVRVTVLPAVSTLGWTLDTLGSHIAGIEGLYHIELDGSGAHGRAASARA